MRVSRDEGREEDEERTQPMSLLVLSVIALTMAGRDDARRPALLKHTEQQQQQSATFSLVFRARHCIDPEPKVASA